MGKPSQWPVILFKAKNGKQLSKNNNPYAILTLYFARHGRELALFDKIS